MSQSGATDLANSSVLGAIIDNARRDPHHPAAKDLRRELNYVELIEEAGRIGAALRSRGVGEGDRVALFIPNSVDFLIAALACLGVGAVFVPLAVTDPPSRLETVLADCSPTLIVTSSDIDIDIDIDSPIPHGAAPSVSMDVLRQEGPVPPEPINAQVGEAYIIYTSGTTGTPKGVQISNAAFAAAVQSTANALGLGPATRTLCVSPFHFDGSYANLFPTLVSGGTVVIRPRAALLYPRTFFNAVATEQINYSGFTPSYLRLLLASQQISSLNDSTLTTIALGGEPPSVDDLRSLWSYSPTIRVFNRYGPTETTIAVTNVELTSEAIENNSVPIGRPHPGVSFVLVNDGQVIEERNQVGELYIGGVQLMSGYWADPQLTSEVMRTDIIPNSLLYRTGDLVYRDGLGNYIYVDRADRVVKRSGVRISLVELGASMNKIDGVEAAACLTFDNGGEMGIVAFVTTRREFSVVELRRAAKLIIPENMLPDKVERVNEMPLNRSNQLDEIELLSAAGLRPYRPASASPV